MNFAEIAAIDTDYKLKFFSRILKTVAVELEVMYRISLILLRPAADESTKEKPEFNPLLDSCTWLTRVMLYIASFITYSNSFVT